MKCKRIYYVLVLLVLTFTTGCCTGLYRNSFEGWERKDFPTLGFSVELPSDCEVSCYDKLHHDNRNKQLWLSLHSYYPMALTEPITLINIQIVLVSKKDLGKYLNKGIDYFNEGGGTIHDTIKEYNTHWFNGTTPMIQYRKDYLTNDGGAVLCGAGYLKEFQDNNKDVEEDIKAITRILNSVKVYPDIDTSNLPIPKDGK